MELFPGAICNLGAGVSTGLSTIAAEEGLLDAAILTNEQGSSAARRSPAAIRAAARISRR